MSIYFQYPSIYEYENLISLVKPEKEEMQKKIDEDRINEQYLEELKDFLALKPI